MSMLGKERVKGLVTHGWMELVNTSILAITVVIVILKASDQMISWSKLTEVGKAGVGVSEGDRADDVIMTIVLIFFLTLGVRMTAAMLEPVSHASGYALT